MAQPSSLSTVQRLYLAYYGRPADPGGLQFWADKLEAAQGSLAGITDAFANSAESQALFGSSTTHRAHVTLIYQQLLGRSPEVQGLNYYVDQLNRGKITLVNAALSILDGAQGADLTRVQQREAAATQFTAALDLPREQAAYAGETKAQIVRDALASVTDQASTLSAFSAGLDGLVLRLLGGQLVQGSVTAGPIVDGNGLQVTAYDAQGNVLGSGALNPDGSYRITIEREYTGPILVRVVDASQGADYVDETRGQPVDLTSDLRALSTVAGAGSYVVNINPLTELITRRVGLQGGDNATSQLVLGATTPEQIQNATQEIATALGLGNVNPVTTTPVTTVTATGSANPAADTLGRVLAAISGQESGQGASTDKVLNTILGSLTGSGAQTQLTPTAQRDLLVGAATADRSGAVGVTNSLAQNLGTPASTAAQIQNTVSQLADLADKKISTTTLTPADFAAIGVTGVTNENLNAVLNQVAQRPSGAEQVNSTGKVQDLVPAPAPAPAPAPEPAPPPAPTNTPPTSTNTTVTALEDTAKVLAASDFGTYADAENTPLAAVKITTLPGKGTLETNSSGSNWTAVTANQVISKADLDAGKLRYTAAANENGNAYTTLGFKVGDGTDFSTAAYTQTFNVTAVNDAPVRTAGTLNALNVNEDSSGSLGLSSFTYGAGGGTDEAAQTLTYRVTSIPSFIDVRLSDGSALPQPPRFQTASVVTLAQLQGLIYQAKPNQSGTGNITFTVTDNGSSTAPNVNLLTETLSITVNAVNDAPVNTVPAGRIVPKNAATAITGLSVADVDIGSSDLTVTLGVVKGTITVAAANGVTISNNNSASVQLVGSLTAVNAALAAPSGVMYQGNTDYIGSETLTLTSNDGGATGSGGPLTDTDTVALTVSAAGVTIVTPASLNLATGVISTTAQDVGGDNANLSYQVAGTSVASGMNGTNAQGARVLLTQPDLVLPNTLSGVLQVTNGTQTVDTTYNVTYGTNNADTATATADSLLYGFGGDDNLTGSAGNDTIYGGTGADIINAGAGADTVGVVLSGTPPGFDADRINLGGNAGDTLRIGPTTGFSGEIAIGFVPDEVGNGSGTLRLITSPNTNFPYVTAVNTYNGKNFDIATHLELNNTNVSIITPPESTTLALRLVGLGANHVAVDGGDRVRGFQKGNYTVADTQNTATAYYGAHFLSSADDNFTTPTLPSNAQYVNAGAGHDTVSGGTGVDFLEGGAGNDSLSGGGGTAADVLVGGSGDDTLVGGTGNDSLIGGLGRDVFVRTDQDGEVGDSIYDFELGTDRLSDGSATPAFFGGAGTQKTLLSFTGTVTDYDTFLANQLNANQVENGVIAIRHINTSAGGASYTRIVVEKGNTNTAAFTIFMADNIGTPDTTLVSEFYGVAAAAPTVTTAAAVSASNPQQITFTADDADSPSLSALVGSTAVSLTGTVNKGSTSTLTVAAQTSATQGELKVSDSALSTNLGLYLGLGTEANGDTLAQTGSNPAALYGFGGNDTLAGGTLADVLVGGTGTDTYNLGSDTAIDTVVEAGSAVTITSGAISGFDLIQEFVTGQDVLSFNGGTGKQLTGTYTAGTNGAGTFVVGAGGNDVIVFNDASSSGTTGMVDAGEAAVVLIGLSAGGAAVDLNGAADGNGYALAEPQA